MRKPRQLVTSGLEKTAGWDNSSPLGSNKSCEPNWILAAYVSMTHPTKRLFQDSIRRAVCTNIE